jgi:AAA domain
VPYRLPELLARSSEPIVLLEGEKGVNRAFKAGLLATCVQGGIWTDLVADQFAGREVIICPDADDAGEEKLAKALTHLTRVGARVRVVRLPGLKRRQDLYDWLEAGHTAPELLALALSQPEVSAINISLYVCPEEASIAPYNWLYGRHLLRGEVSCTVAPGGLGKSNLNIAEALALVTGMRLLQHSVPSAVRVLLLNLEDNRNTMDKRIAATRRLHELTPTQLGERLFIVAKDEVEKSFGGRFSIASVDRWGKLMSNETLIKALIEHLISRSIDVMIIDPLTLAHEVKENDPGQFRAMVEAFGYVARQANCAISLWHHTRKSNGAEMSVESARGAMSLTDTCRDSRLGEKMTTEEGQQLKLKDIWRYFRLFTGKVNYAPPTEDSEWYKIATVELKNGEQVSAVQRWEHPGAAALTPTPDDLEKIKKLISEGLNRQDVRAANWAGYAVAQVMRLDHKQPDHRTQINKLLKKMFDDGVLQHDIGKDSHRDPKPIYRVTPDEVLK